MPLHLLLHYAIHQPNSVGFLSLIAELRSAKARLQWTGIHFTEHQMRLVKFFWILSLLGFLGADLFVYGDGPAILNLHFDESGAADYALKKIHFFYYSLVLFLIPNVILMLLGYALPFLPKGIFLVAKKDVWLAPDNRKVFFRIAKEWIRGFAFILNMFLMFALMGIYYINTSHQFPINWGFYFVAICGIGWLFYGIPLFKKHPDDFA